MSSFNHTITFQLPEELYLKLAELAEREDRTPDQQARYLVRNALAHAPQADLRLDSTPMKLVHTDAKPEIDTSQWCGTQSDRGNVCMLEPGHEGDHFGPRMRLARHGPTMLQCNVRHADFPDLVCYLKKNHGGTHQGKSRKGRHYSWQGLNGEIFPVRCQAESPDGLGQCEKQLGHVGEHEQKLAEPELTWRW